MNNILAINSFISTIRPFIPGLKWKFNLRIFYLLCFSLIGIFFVFYIFQINSVIQKTYLLKNYEAEFSLLSEETQALGVKFAQANTLENIELLIKDLSYEKIEEIRYIQLVGSQVVTK